MTDEQQIRDLIQHWAVAVHDGDLPTVLGLQKVDGRWVVTHEHHSFADTSGTTLEQ